MSSPSKLIKNFLLQLFFLKNILVIYRSLPVKHAASVANAEDISAQWHGVTSFDGTLLNFVGQPIMQP